MSGQVQQMLLPFASLDFFGRKAVTLSEIAEKLGCSVDHLSNLVEDGTIVSVDLARHHGESRRMIRVPVEEYRQFVLTRLTGERRKEFISELPLDTVRELHVLLGKRLGVAA